MQTAGTTLRNMNIRYSFLHGGYWMVFGATYNFVTVYLLSKNFASDEIGIILASTNIFSALLQPLVAGFADRSKKDSLRAITSLMLFVCLSISVIMTFAPEIMVITALLYFLLLTVMLTIHPLINALGINYINKGLALNFGAARGMGSLTYAIMSLTLGVAVDRKGTDILPFVFAALFGLTFLFAIIFRLKSDEMLPEERHDQMDIQTHKGNSSDEPDHLSLFGFVAKYKKFTAYLMGIILIFICFNIINIYMIKIVENVGGNETSMGTAFAIAAVLELPVMLTFSKLIRRYDIGMMLKFSAMIFTLKTFVTLVSTNMFMIYVAQGLQMLSYAIFIPGSIYYVNQVLERKDMIKGQAFTTAATTLGGVGGSLIGGWLLTFTSVANTLLFGLTLSALGLVVMFFSIETRKINGHSY
ncbi:MFS transporter [Proteiniclasticum sp.]|uniref:MFS transporter n=1 Tax=Proteiniclasticum sp. TaxID=2053595 RepID=UPI00289CB28E|nr:MFS transporter [Proteiniclasticum sp.]